MSKRASLLPSLKAKRACSEFSKSHQLQVLLCREHAGLPFLTGPDEDRRLGEIAAKAVRAWLGAELRTVEAGSECPHLAQDEDGRAGVCARFVTPPRAGKPFIPSTCITKAHGAQSKSTKSQRADRERVGRRASLPFRHNLTAKQKG